MFETLIIDKRNPEAPIFLGAFSSEFAAELQFRNYLSDHPGLEPYIVFVDVLRYSKYWLN